MSNELREAAAELVYLKDHQAGYGKQEHFDAFNARCESAWERLREALAAPAEPKL